jgi:pSer/pThr/pTyr-binding forkhead associated (FHA) protein
MASLVVVEGKGEGGHLPLVEPLISIGREDTCTFQLLDDQVSRKHLQVRLNRTDGRHYAGDYRSANGVFVNGVRIVLDTALADGDRIRIGTTTLVYLAGDHADAVAAHAAAKKMGEWKRETLKEKE